VNSWMSAGPKSSQVTDQKVRGSNPFGRALRLFLIRISGGSIKEIAIKGEV